MRAPRSNASEVDENRRPDGYRREQEPTTTTSPQKAQLGYISPAKTELQISAGPSSSIRMQEQRSPEDLPEESPPNSQTQVDIVEVNPVMGMSRMSMGNLGMRIVKRNADYDDMGVERNDRSRGTGSFSSRDPDPEQTTSQRPQRSGRPSETSSKYQNRLKVDTATGNDQASGSQRSPTKEPPFVQYPPQSPPSERSINTNMYSSYSGYSNAKILNVIEQRDRTALNLRGELEEALTQLDMANRVRKQLEEKLSKRQEGIGDSDVDSGFESINRESRAKDALISELRTQLEDTEAVAERCRKRTRELEMAEESLREALFDTERSLKREKEKREDIQLECDELRNIIASTDLGSGNQSDAVLELEKVNDELRNELRETVSQLDASTSENQGTINELEDVWDLLMENAEGTNSRSRREEFSVDAFVTRTRRLVAAQEETNKTISDLRSQLEELQTRAAGRKRDGDEYDEERRNMEQRLRKEKARFNEELALLEEDADLANKKYREIKRELAFVRSDAETREAEIYKLTNQITILKQEAQFAKEGTDRAYNRSSPSRPNEDQKRNVERLEGQLDSLKDRYQALEQEFAKQEEECERLRLRSSTSRPNEDQKKNVERLEGQLDSLKDRYQALEQDFAKQEEECERLRLIIIASKGDEMQSASTAEAKKRLEDQTRNDSDTIKQLRNDLETATKELASFDTIKASIGEREAGMLKKQSELEMELDAVMREFDRIIGRSADQEETSYRLKSELNDMKSKVEELEARLSEEQVKQLSKTADGDNDEALMEMVAGIRKEYAKERNLQDEEKKRLEGIISSMKRERDLTSLQRSTKGVQTSTFGG